MGVIEMIKKQRTAGTEATARDAALGELDAFVQREIDDLTHPFGRYDYERALLNKVQEEIHRLREGAK